MNDDDAWVPSRKSLSVPHCKKRIHNAGRFQVVLRCSDLPAIRRHQCPLGSGAPCTSQQLEVGGRTLVLLDILLVYWPASSVSWSLLAALLLTYQCQLLFFSTNDHLSCWIGHADSISWCLGSQFISSSLLNLSGFGGIVVSAGSLNQKLPARWIGSSKTWQTCFKYIRTLHWRHATFRIWQNNREQVWSVHKFWISLNVYMSIYNWSA